MTSELELELVPPNALAFADARREALKEAWAHVVDPHAPNTTRTYGSAWKKWRAYADANGLPWLPLEAAELVGYLQGLTRAGAAPNTVRLHLSALCTLDRDARATADNPNPQSLREHVIVQRWEEGWTKKNPRRPRRTAAAFEASGLERVLAQVAERPKNAAPAAHVLQASRDRCLLLFGVCGAFRASDLGELELEHVQVTERGLRVLLPRSKNDQQGDGHYRGLMPQGKRHLCPVEAFTQWRRVRGELAGPLFPPVRRAGELELGRALSERQISRLVTTYGERAGLALHVSGHSLRATFATLASAQGKSLNRIMDHAGWRSADVAVGYMRQAQLFDDNPSAGLLE